MDLGKDTFKWFAFIVELIKLFIKVFGDDNDNEELNKNRIDIGNN